MAIHIPLTTDGSAELFRRLIAGRTKLIAARLQRNTNVVINWQTQPPSEENPNSGGDYNPFDWIIRVLTALGGDQARQGCDWICRQFNGRFVPTDGGPGDGKFFREPIDAIPHLKTLLAELKKPNASARVVRAHLDEAFTILTAHFQEDAQNGHDGQND